MIPWSEETAVIKMVASEHGVDPLFVAAVRKAENGGPGREFGVVSRSAPSYEEQCATTAKTIRNQLVLFNRNPLVKQNSRGGVGRLCYSMNFIAAFQKVWAPVGVDNDPHNLNSNWYTNVLEYYNRFILEGL